MTSTRIGKLELCCDVKRKQIFFETDVADRNPVMASNRLQIAMKRLTCCNILGSGFPSGIKVSFENIVSEILSDYTLHFRRSQLHMCSSLKLSLLESF